MAKIKLQIERNRTPNRLSRWIFISAESLKIQAVHLQAMKKRRKENRRIRKGTMGHLILFTTYHLLRPLCAPKMDVLLLSALFDRYTQKSSSSAYRFNEKSGKTCTHVIAGRTRCDCQHGFYFSQKEQDRLNRIAEVMLPSFRRKLENHFLQTASPVLKEVQKQRKWLWISEPADNSRQKHFSSTFRGTAFSLFEAA